MKITDQTKEGEFSNTDPERKRELRTPGRFSSRRTGAFVLAVLVSCVAAALPTRASGPTPGTGSEGTERASDSSASTEKRKGSPSDKTVKPPRIQMLPSNRKASVGDTLTIRVRLENGSDVGSVPFHVTFNAQVLQFESGEEGSFLRRDGAQTAFFASPMSTPGEIVVGLSRLGSGDGAKGSGDLCRLTFRVISRGDAALEFKRASVKDPHDKILGSAFQTAKVRTR